MGPVAKRRKLAQPRREEEILFDPNARQQFLTGFHKRKLQRTKHAQEATERRAKEDRRAERKRVGRLVYEAIDCKCLLVLDT